MRYFERAGYNTYYTHTVAVMFNVHSRVIIFVGCNFPRTVVGQPTAAAVLYGTLLLSFVSILNATGIFVSMQ